MILGIIPLETNIYFILFCLSIRMNSLDYNLTSYLDYIPEDLIPTIREFIIGYRVMEIFIDYKRLYYVNSKGNEHGNWKMWYEDDQLWIDFNCKNGKRHGNFKTWYEDGQIKWDYNFKDGKDHGNFKKWYSDGQLESDYNYINGEPHGNSMVGNKLTIWKYNFFFRYLNSILE